MTQQIFPHSTAIQNAQNLLYEWGSNSPNILPGDI